MKKRKAYAKEPCINKEYGCTRMSEAVTKRGPCHACYSRAWYHLRKGVAHCMDYKGRLNLWLKSANDLIGELGHRGRKAS